MNVLELYHQELARNAAETRKETLVELFAKKLARPLTDAERETVTNRIATLGSSAVEDALLDLDRAALADWLAAP